MSRYWDLRGPAPTLRGPDYRITRAQLRILVDEAKGRMRQAGVGPASTLVLRLPAGASFVAFLLAAWELRACVCIIDHRAPRGAHSALTAVATHEVSLVGRLPCVTPRDATPERRPVAEGAFAVLQSSSGTTAPPKAVIRTEEAIDAELRRYERFGATVDGAGQSIVLASSVAHSWALVAGLLQSLRIHREVIFPARSNAGELGRALSTAPFPSQLLGTPPHLAALLALEVPAPGLRHAVIAGAPLSAAQTLRFRSMFPAVQVGQVYGMTETGVIAADWAGRHPGTVGRIADDLVWRMDARGHLSVMLPSSPYLAADHTPQDGLPALVDTGDLVTIDADRRLRVEGRLSGYVTFRSPHFHATDLEQRLAMHLPAGGGVVAVLAGECIEVYVEGGRAAFDTTIAAVDDLPSAMAPDVVRQVSKIPRTPAGKALRRQELLAALVIT